MRGQSNPAQSPDFVAKLGAEAKIELYNWLGRMVIRKSRLTKDYRNPDLDQLIRTRRTRQETEILYRAKLAGVRSPAVYFVDPQRAEIYMEYVPGLVLKDFGLKGIIKDRTCALSAEEVYETVGRYAAKLHKSKIIHGDLTTKNVVISGKLEIFFLDFGLSFISDRIEDKAEDLHLLRQALRSTKSTMQEKSIFETIMKGYSNECGTDMSKQVLRQMHEIERRGRYARVD